MLMTDGRGWPLHWIAANGAKRDIGDPPPEDTIGPRLAGRWTVWGGVEFEGSLRFSLNCGMSG
jgi:hypothetical protein